MRKILPIVSITTAGLVAALVACAAPGSPDKPGPAPSRPAAVTTSAVERPGSPAVYASIAAETDCVKLQTSFDTAAAAHDRDKARSRLDLMEIDTAYMQAIDARMRELKCY